LTSDWRPIQREGVWLKRGRTTSVRDTDGTKLCVLNDTAAALWELCDGETTVEEMAVAVRDLFGVTLAAARTDVTDALAALQTVDALKARVS